MRGAPGTIGAQAAKSLGMNHDVCDPSSADRESLGITNVGDIELHAALDHWPREQFEARIAEHCRIRETYWLARFREADTWPVLFICGANRSDSFAKLLKAEGYSARDAEADFGSKSDSQPENA